MTKGRPVNPATRARIVAEATRLYQSGLNLRDTARAVGTPYTTTYAWLTEAGITLRPGRKATGKQPPTEAALLLRADFQHRYYAGLTVQEIADTTNLPYGLVRYHLRAADTVFRPIGRRPNRKEQQA